MNYPLHCTVTYNNLLGRLYRGMRAVVRDAYYVVIIISNLIDIKLLEIYRINSKVILQTENQKKRSVETINLGKY